MNLQQINDLVKKISRWTGVDDYELLLTFGTTLTARVENREITIQIKKDIFSGSLRVIKNSRLGFVPFTEPNPTVLEQGIKIALEKAPETPLVNFVVIPEQLNSISAFDREITELLNTPSRIKKLVEKLR